MRWRKSHVLVRILGPTRILIENSLVICGGLILPTDFRMDHHFIFYFMVEKSYIFYIYAFIHTPECFRYHRYFLWAALRSTNISVFFNKKTKYYPNCHCSTDSRNLYLQHCWKVIGKIIIRNKNNCLSYFCYCPSEF